MATNGVSASKPNTLFSTGQFQLLPATADDADAIQRCAMRANEHNFAYRLLYPKEKARLNTPEELFAFRVGRIRRSMEKDKDALHFKVIDTSDSNRIIGTSLWFKPGHFKPDSSILTDFNSDAKKAAADGGQPQLASDGFPASMNVDVHREILAEQDKKRKEIWGDDSNFWYLGALSVDPEYQRKGVATALMKEGLDRADADGIPIYLEATPEGALFYPHVGFRKLGETDFFGGKFSIAYHIRPPGGVSDTAS